MILSTGKVCFELEFDNGEKAKIHFNPNNREFLDRIKVFEKKINDRANKIDREKYATALSNELPEIDFSNPDEFLKLSEKEIEEISETVDATCELAREYNTILKDEFDELFGEKMSDSVFKYCEPLDIVTYEIGTGEIVTEVFAAQFIRWLLKEIKRYSDKTNEVLNRHVGKYYQNIK